MHNPSPNPGGVNPDVTVSATGRSTPDRPRIALIGAGRMGYAVLTGLLRDGWPSENLVAVEADQSIAQSLRDELGIVVTTASAAAADAEVVIVAVKPHQVFGVLATIRGSLRPGTLVISLAAGLPLAQLESHLPKDTPVIRVMPNTPALVGQGMSVMSPSQSCTPDQVVEARRVLECLGQVAQVPDAQQDAVTAVSGSGPAYVFYFAEAMIDAAVMLGLPRPLAVQLTHQTLLGAATMLVATGESATVLRQNVTSPGGTTAAALHALDEAALRAAVGNAMRACRDRSAELGRT